MSDNEQDAIAHSTTLENILKWACFQYNDKATYYKKFSIRSEHSLFVDFKDDDGNNNYTSNLWIEDKEWSFTFSPDDDKLSLKMSMHSADTSKFIAECIIWCWADKEIVILAKIVSEFGSGLYNENFVFTKLVPRNKKFSVVIRLLDERTASENSVESHYGDYDCGLEKVTLTVAGAEKASFTVPKVDLFRASPVFRRMFTVEMKEKATCKIEEIPDTNPEEFGAFLKAISPKQEHPNPSNILALLKLAHLYECQTLLDRCERHLMNCVEIPMMKLLYCADLYGLNRLHNLLMSFDESVPALLKWYKHSKPYIDWMQLFFDMDPWSPDPEGEDEDW